MPVEDTKAKVIKVPGRSPKKAPDRLPWPRNSELDESGKIASLGIDVVAKRKDIEKIVHKFFKVENVPMEELMQEVFVAIIHKNYTRSAHDPRKSSFGHYVYMVANNVCINLVHKKRRYDRESDSIDTPNSYDDSRTILDIFSADNEQTDIVSDHLEQIEQLMRQKGMWDQARYVRAVRSGANPNIIREALSWGNHRVSSKTIRDLRHQIQAAIKDHVEV